jgi:hypothetical protein
MSDRKYRQRGYQDSDRPAYHRREEGDPLPPRPDLYETGPRGRGLGRPTATVFRCAACGALQPATKVELDSLCIACKAELHTCTNCRHFDPGATAECRKPVKVRVAAKAKRNECELFAPRETQESAPASGPPGPTGPPSRGGARAAFDALFKL